MSTGVIICDGAKHLLKTYEENIQYNKHVFPCGEMCPNFTNAVYFDTIRVVQSLCSSEDIIELMLILDALHRDSKRIMVEVFIPYYGYGRQDKKIEEEPVSATLILEMISVFSLQAIYVVDIHNQCTLDNHTVNDIIKHNISSCKLFYQTIRRDLQPDSIVVAPDFGAIKRAKIFAEELTLNMVVLHKERDDVFKGSMKIVVMGNVKDKHCIIVDDIVDSGRTLRKAAKELKASGARSVTAYITHAVLSGDAIKEIEEDINLDKLVVSNSIKNELVGEKIEVVSVTPLIYELANNGY